MTKEKESFFQVKGKVETWKLENWKARKQQRKQTEQNKKKFNLIIELSNKQTKQNKRISYPATANW